VEIDSSAPQRLGEGSFQQYMTQELELGVAESRPVVRGSRVSARDRNLEVWRASATSHKGTAADACLHSSFPAKHSGTAPTERVGPSPSAAPLRAKERVLFW
jgi:hypothetical protein